MWYWLESDISFGNLYGNLNASHIGRLEKTHSECYITNLDTSMTKYSFKLKMPFTSKGFREKTGNNLRCNILKIHVKDKTDIDRILHIYIDKLTNMCVHLFIGMKKTRQKNLQFHFLLNISVKSLSLWNTSFTLHFLFK